MAGGRLVPDDVAEPGGRSQVVVPAMLPGTDGANINGPSCIEVPAWVEGRLARYYLYFAHRSGDHIRLAYADDPAGPWTIHEGGVLPAAGLTQGRGPVTSPDAVIDEAGRRIRLYYRAADRGGRPMSWLATSSDGLNFVSASEPLTEGALRVVRWRDGWIGLGKGGALYVSRSGTDDFRRLPSPAFPVSGPDAGAPRDVRHVALDVDGDRLWVLFTRIGDAPEHVRLGVVDLARPPAEWQMRDDVELLRPAEEWEGANLPPAPSRAGPARGAENALRDPAVLRSDGKAWLFYAYAGEQGIALARLPDLSGWHARMTEEKPAVAAEDDADPARRKRASTLAALAQPGVLAATLAKLDETAPRRRIYVMGCGRSGTWLLASLMTCFDGVHLVTEELRMEFFALVRTSKPIVVLKRAWNSYRRMEEIARTVRILYIVRHPFDVLTSHNPATGKQYHIEPDRWLGEMTELRKLVEAGDPRHLVVRYEDLVGDTEATLGRIGETFDLSLVASPDEIMGKIELPGGTRTAMHGLRPVDSNSVGRYRGDPEAVERLRAIVPGLGETLEWVAGRFGYDIALP